MHRPVDARHRRTLTRREVNDVRDGIYFHLNHVPRSAILACGLLLVAFCASWVGAIFLIALGLLVGHGQSNGSKWKLAIGRWQPDDLGRRSPAEHE